MFAALTALLLTLGLQSGAWPPAPPIVVPEVSDLGELPASVTAEVVGGGYVRCVFHLGGEAEAESVHLAGTFNGWSRDATPMRRAGRGGWEVELVLEPGEHHYKFVVDGERWLADPDNPEGADDGHAGTNSVLRLGAIDASSALPGDGVIEARALEHDVARALYRQRAPGGGWILRYRTLADDVQRVTLRVRAGGRAAVPMALALRGDPFDLWEARVDDVRRPTDYTFVLFDGDLRVSDPETYRLEPVGDGGFRTPEWAKHAVWYQVMVDRFRNGDLSNDPERTRRWRSEWFGESEWEGKDGQSFYRYFVFARHYGGDIAGLEDKLPYLKELGVNALYLNPVFQAKSHHKYDATNFLHVDEHFGTKGDYAEAEAKEDLLDPSTWRFTESDRRFLAFLKVAKGQGFRVIIDGVFNHVGTAHPAFRDVREKGEESRFADWFDVRSWDPFEYEGWGGFGGLPAFKKSADGLASESLKQHIFAITRRWMDPDGDGDPSDGVDGWRLDVPNEVPRGFWEEWRGLVKSINPDAYLTGEIWQRADEWLDGATFDAVMNYPVAAIALEWIGNQRHKIKPSELDRRLAEMRLAYPAEATYALMNLVGSHDTDRIASRMKNPDRPFDGRNRNQDGAEYDEAKPAARHYDKARLLLLFQVTYVGAPMVYYGDEVGMWGADDPSNRKPMLWKELEPYDAEEDRLDEEHLDYYRRALALRNAHPALRTGSFRTLLADDERHLFAYERADASETLVVVLNAGRRAAEVSLAELGLEGAGLECLFGDDERADGALRIPAHEGRVYGATR